MSTQMQQMQVVVPAGVGPGMPFQVNTPSGPMQVVCPAGTAAGSSILLNVPVQVAQPTMVAAQPMVVAAHPVVAPTADPAIMMGTPVQDVSTMTSAPAPQGMNRQSEMDNRMNEVVSGCWGNQPAPCCYMTYLAISPEGIYAGPCCCLCCLFCPCPPGMCGTFKPIAPGSATFKGDDGSTWTFTSKTKFVANGKLNSKDDPHVRFC